MPNNTNQPTKLFTGCEPQIYVISITPILQMMKENRATLKQNESLLITESL